MIIFFTLAASAALTGARPVIASQYDLVRIAVPYADLNLASEQGRQTFDARVHVAAVTICGDGEEGEIDRRADVNECQKAIAPAPGPR